MANGHGGKRRPRKPAPVSGPGRMSRRTDGGPQQTQAQMTGMGYGENQDFMDIQSSAPMAATPSVPAPRMRRAPQEMSVTQGMPSAPAELFAPTQRPDEPVTAGAPVGMGPGALNTQTQESMADLMRRMMEANPTQQMRDLYAIASRLGSRRG